MLHSSAIDKYAQSCSAAAAASIFVRKVSANLAAVFKLYVHMCSHAMFESKQTEYTYTSLYGAQLNVLSLSAYTHFMAYKQRCH
jgi:hypothetical protein